MEKLRSFVRAYNNFEKWTLIVMMGLLVVVIFAQVFTRYVMGQALFWSEEFGKFLFVWMSWLGVSAGLNEKEHIQVKLFPNALRNRGKLRSEKAVYILVDALWFFTSILMVVYGWEIISGQLETGVYGAATRIPMWIPYLSVPVSGVLVCLKLTGEIYTYTWEIIKGPQAIKER